MGDEKKQTFIMAGVSGISGTTATALSTAPKTNLGKDEFLELLTTQLKNQNPLEPLDNAAFIAQLATFSQLEQIINLNKSFSDFMSTSQKSAALSILGKDVSGTTAKGEAVTGKAVALEYDKQGKITVTLSTLEGEIKVPWENISYIATPEVSI